LELHFLIPVREVLKISVVSIINIRKNIFKTMEIRCVPLFSARPSAGDIFRAGEELCVEEGSVQSVTS
jgi:hypothetical protein